MDPNPGKAASPPSRRPRRSARGKRAELARWLEREQPAEIGEREWTAIELGLAPVSSGYLRRLLRESGVRLAPVVEGVRQEDMTTLERSLLALFDEYERGDAARRAMVRRLVIEAKDHARWSARRKPDTRPVKEEMALWMLTWLENPPLFRQWVQLRKRSETGV
jgi:hypothetical protein